MRMPWDILEKIVRRFDITGAHASVHALYSMASRVHVSVGFDIILNSISILLTHVCIRHLILSVHVNDMIVFLRIVCED